MSSAGNIELVCFTNFFINSSLVPVRLIFVFGETCPNVTTDNPTNKTKIEKIFFTAHSNYYAARFLRFLSNVSNNKPI